MNFETDYKKIPEFDNLLNPTINPITAGIIGVIFVAVAFQLFGSLITLAIFGFDINKIDKNSMRLLTMASQFLFILLPTLLITRFVYTDISTILRVRRFPTFKEIFFSILGLIFVVPIAQLVLSLYVYLISELSKVSTIILNFKKSLDFLDKMMSEGYKGLLTPNNPIEVILIVFVVSITPAICEEVFFRGYVQKSFELRLDPYLAIVLTSLFFAIYHFNPYGAPPLVILSFYFGYIAYKSRTLFLTMILHFINNIFSTLMFIFGGEEYTSYSELGNFDLNTTLMQLGIVGFLMFLVLIAIERNYQKMEEK